MKSAFIEFVERIDFAIPKMPCDKRRLDVMMAFKVWLSIAFEVSEYAIDTDSDSLDMMAEKVTQAVKLHNHSLAECFEGIETKAIGTAAFLLHSAHTDTWFTQDELSRFYMSDFSTLEKSHAPEIKPFSVQFGEIFQHIVLQLIEGRQSVYCPWDSLGQVAGRVCEIHGQHDYVFVESPFKTRYLEACKSNTRILGGR